MPPTITVEPKESLADENVSIRIDGLQSYQPITIHAVLERSDVGHFDSFAKYRATNDGTVDISNHTSLGGSYIGIEPMGLFWSMKSSAKNKRPNLRYIVRNVENPICVQLQVYDTHLSYEDLCQSKYNTIAVTSFKRLYKSVGVKRRPVRWKRLRGTLFVPEGNGPFPTLVHLTGGTGGLSEYRPALLASRGYMTLALAYIKYDDLPKAVGKEFDLRYFEDAKEFLELQPDYNQNGIGILGISLGGMLAVACNTYIPGFKCAVSINGYPFTFLAALRYKQILRRPKFANLRLRYEDNGKLFDKYCLDEHHDLDVLGDSLIEFPESGKPFLFIFGKDDTSLNSVKAASLVEKMTKNGKGDYKIVTYAGAGHLIEPPQFPHTLTSYVSIFRADYSWGGEAKKHALAQELAWEEIKMFLNKHLNKNRSRSKL